MLRQATSFGSSIRRWISIAPINLYINRGCSYWTDGRRERRILMARRTVCLFSIDAVSGRPDPAFGKDGDIDLRPGVADKFPERGYGVTSAPAIYKNLVITGAAASDGEPQGPSGDIRAFDIGSGKLVWTFHTVPRSGEFGNETWEGRVVERSRRRKRVEHVKCRSTAGIVFVPLIPSTGNRHLWR